MDKRIVNIAIGFLLLVIGAVFMYLSPGQSFIKNPLAFLLIIIILMALYYSVLYFTEKIKKETLMTKKTLYTLLIVVTAFVLYWPIVFLIKQL